MQKRAKLLASMGFILSFIFAGSALAQNFSADVVNTSSSGTFKGKIFVAKDKARIESPESIVITRTDKKISWIIIPAQKMYMEQPFDPRNIVAAGEKLPGEIERTLIGEETVDGKKTSKYRIVYETLGKRETVFQWIAADSKMPLKTAAEDNTWIVEYKNLTLGTQPDALFEVPEGYKKFSYEIPSIKNIMPQTGK